MTNDWGLELSGGLFIHMPGTSIGRNQRLHLTRMLIRLSIHGLSLVNSWFEVGEKEKNPRKNNLESEHYKTK